MTYADCREHFATEMTLDCPSVTSSRLFRIMVFVQSGIEIELLALAW